LKIERIVIRSADGRRPHVHPTVARPNTEFSVWAEFETNGVPASSSSSELAKLVLPFNLTDVSFSRPIGMKTTVNGPLVMVQIRAAVFGERDCAQHVSARAAE